MTNNYKLVFRLSSVLILGGIGLGASGCTVTATVSSGTCSADSTVDCSADPNSAGYSCAGTDFPSDTISGIVCSDGISDADGNIDYCCEAESATFGCNTDGTVVCSGGAAGYSCVGGATPDDPTLLCSDGTTDGSNVDFCCITVSGTPACSVDATITCPSAGSYGFNCASGSSPTDVDSTLTCSQPTSTSAADLFCCTDGTTTTTTDACNADTTVDCSADPTSSGYTCTGEAVPSDSDSTIVCSDGTVNSDGSVGYCCASAGSTTFGCTNPDPNVTGCTGGATGVSCLGGATPDTTALSCSIPVPDATTANQEDFCCIAFAATDSTCAPDDTVTCPQAGSYGFSCATGDNPNMIDSTLTCSSATSSGDQDLFCCQ